MTDIDWKTELRKIEREFSGLPPEPSPKDVRRQRTLEQQERMRQQARAAAIGTWGRLVLVVALGVAIAYWPYPRACGSGLAGYLGAEVLLAGSAVWTAIYAWQRRLAIPHVIALVLLFCACTMLEVQTLPRAGYVTLFGADPVTWSCRAVS
jgi:hypothetical protein